MQIVVFLVLFGMILGVVLMETVESLSNFPVPVVIVFPTFIVMAAWNHSVCEHN